MNDDYFNRVDRQLARLTMEGAHLDPPAKWSPDRWGGLRAARRTVVAVAVALALVLAALLVIEFPGSASGSIDRRNGAVAAAVADGPPISGSTAVRGLVGEAE